MKQISCRERGEVRNERIPRYVNFDFQQIDGKMQLTPCDPVAPSLAKQFSVEVNVVTNKPSNLVRQRINVDAVDLQQTLSKIK